MRILAIATTESIDPVFIAAFRMARQFNGRVVGTSGSAPLDPVLMAPEMGVVLSDVHGRLVEAAEEQGQRARRAFEVVAGSADGQGVPAEWLKAPGGPDPTSVGQIGRIFDLTVVGRPSRLSSPSGALLETVLFETGRPMLMVPPEVPARIGRRVLIAWNRSTETARAVSMADRILRAAEAIEVFSVEGGLVPGPEGALLAETLQQDGMSVSARHVGNPGRSTAGEATVEAAAAFGADLIVKGAYTNSRLRQMIFGGLTQHLITSADRPVLFAH